MTADTDPKRKFLRHTLATLAYRAGKAIRNAPPHFAGLSLGEGTRTPAEILAHMGDLLDWSLAMASGDQSWRESSPLPWEAEVERFFEALDRFEGHLASGKPVDAAPERLFQGPIADALTHVGQLALMRRIADAPVRGENYFVAEIRPGMSVPL